MSSGRFCWASFPWFTRRKKDETEAESCGGGPCQQGVCRVVSEGLASVVEGGSVSFFFYLYSSGRGTGTKSTSKRACQKRIRQPASEPVQPDPLTALAPPQHRIRRRGG